MNIVGAASAAISSVAYIEQSRLKPLLQQGKFILEKIVGWADGFIVCPRGLASAWAQKRAHPF